MRIFQRYQRETWPHNLKVSRTIESWAEDQHYPKFLSTAKLKDSIGKCQLALTLWLLSCKQRLKAVYQLENRVLNAAIRQIKRIISEINPRNIDLRSVCRAWLWTQVQKTHHVIHLIVACVDLKMILMDYLRIGIPDVSLEPLAITQAKTKTLLWVRLLETMDYY